MKHISTLCFLSSIFLTILACTDSGHKQLDEIIINPPYVNTSNIEIVRDSFGVPHIFSETDREAVYGIAWAQCEDNFNLMQEKLFISKGMSGIVNGEDGAALDYILQLFEIEEFINERYTKDISPTVEGFLRAYTNAINRYAATHPEEVESYKIFPVTTMDILKGSILNFLLMSHVGTDLAKIASSNIGLYLSEGNFLGAGSNALAFSPKVTKDGKSYLVGNPHQPIEGPASFWELSVHSNEGFEMFGATFAGGGLFPALGANKFLSWTHTTNFEDYADVYELKMHPEKKGVYEFDGEWIPLEQKTAQLRVKYGPVIIPVKRPYYSSKYGPTLKNDTGYYAIRSNCFYNLRLVEQYYKMGKSKNLAEFKEALKIQSVPSQTITYADFEGNIFHLSNGIMPVRSEKFEWRKLIPGNTSETLWSYQEKHPQDALIQVNNPEAGYVYTCNNSPLFCTAVAENPKLENYPKSFGILTSNTMRAIQMQKLLKNCSDLDLNAIKKIRNDLYVSKTDNHRNFMNAKDILAMLSKDDSLRPAYEAYDRWDGRLNIENRNAAFVSVLSVFITQYITSKYSLYETTIPEHDFIELATRAQDFLLKHYGTLEVELGKVQRIIRGDLNFPMYGGPSSLANAHFELMDNGQLKCVKGDSYLFYAQFNESGLEKYESINVYGNSNKPIAPHYNNQLPLYVNMELKNASLDRAAIRENGVKIYHPKTSEKD